MSKTTDRLDGMLAGFIAMGPLDAESLLRARVALGTCSSSEWWRYHLGLGPSKRARELSARHAENMRRHAEVAARWSTGRPGGEA